MSNNKVTKLKPRSKPAALDTPTDLNDAAVKAVSVALNGLLADSYALYLKTKNFHWHASGPHFRDYHLLFDEQAADILGATDDMAERVRKIGGTTLRSIGHIAKLQTVIEDNDEEFVRPADMLRELMNDNKKVAEAMRKAHGVRRRSRRCGHREPDRGLARSDRETDLVPVRGERAAAATTDMNQA